MASVRSRLFLLAGLLAVACPVSAQQATQAPPPKHKSGFVPGTPLDTIRNAHLFASVPDAKDFVRKTRPPIDSLSYQPFTSQVHDVVRPKTRTPNELADLEHQLDGARVRAQRAGSAVVRHARPAD